MAIVSSLGPSTYQPRAAPKQDWRTARACHRGPSSFPPSRPHPKALRRAATGDAAIRVPWGGGSPPCPQSYPCSAPSAQLRCSRCRRPSPYTRLPGQVVRPEGCEGIPRAGCEPRAVPLPATETCAAGPASSQLPAARPGPQPSHHLARTLQRFLLLCDLWAAGSRRPRVSGFL